MGRKDRRQNGEAGAWVGGRGGGAVGSVGTTLTASVFSVK